MGARVVLFEGRTTREPGVRYPRCLAGARACPPEDVGGPSGHEEFLVALADPWHEAHEAMREWCGGDFDPERFVPEALRVTDPQARWREAFGRRFGWS